MSQINVTEIPTRIDDPQHLLLWSADEVVPIATGLIIGMIIHKALICTLIGFGMTHFYRKFRDQHPDGFLMHKLYSWGFSASTARSMKNPFIKQYYP